MKEFNRWSDEDDLTTQGNPFADGTPAYWAWEGWNAGVKTEREACAFICEHMGIDGYGTLAIAAAIRARNKT